MSRAVFAAGGCQARARFRPDMRQRFRIPVRLRPLVRTTGSFTAELGRYAGRSVHVVVLAEGWLAAQDRRHSSDDLPPGRIWRRQVELVAGDVRVRAETRVSLGGHLGLLRALQRLDSTPLIRLLRHLRGCRRTGLRAEPAGDTVRRISRYRAGRARIWLAETIPLSA